MDVFNGTIVDGFVVGFLVYSEFLAHFHTFRRN
jgi:hypothetical protein